MPEPYGEVEEDESNRGLLSCIRNIQDQQRKVHSRVSTMAKSIVVKPRPPTVLPQAIAALIRDAAQVAVENNAVQEVDIPQSPFIPPRKGPLRPSGSLKAGGRGGQGAPSDDEDPLAKILRLAALPHASMKPIKSRISCR